MAMTWLPGVETNITPSFTSGVRLVALHRAGRKRPHRLQARDVLRRELLERAEAPSVVGAPDHQPVPVVGTLQPIRRDRLVVLKGRRDGQLGSLRGLQHRAGGDGEDARP